MLFWLSDYQSIWLLCWNMQSERATGLVWLTFIEATVYFYYLLVVHTTQNHKNYINAILHYYVSGDQVLWFTFPGLRVWMFQTLTIQLENLKWYISQANHYFNSIITYNIINLIELFLIQVFSKPLF